MHADDVNRAHLLPPAGSCTCSKVRGLARSLTSLYDAELARHGLTVTQYAALATLMHGQRALSVAALARRLQMNRTTTSRLVGPLEQEGLVARVEVRGVGGDARARPLQLTSKGRRRLLAAVPSWHAAQKQVETLLGAPLQDALNRTADAAARALATASVENPEAT
jgi:DNA-binding MarR family transcriptional regulator